MHSSLARRLLAELLGTAMLLTAVVGAGIAAQRLSSDQVGLQLLEDSLVTGAALVAIILALGPISGAHLNPEVTLADRLLGGRSSWRDCVGYAWPRSPAPSLGSSARTSCSACRRSRSPHT